MHTFPETRMPNLTSRKISSHLHQNDLTYLLSWAHVAGTDPLIFAKT
jgi:hypothetical protein